VLSDFTDRLGLDVNEASWTISWVMECYEKGIFTRNDLDGLEMNWGDVESVRSLLIKISRRDGIGNLLAEGVKRAAETVGGEALKMAVYVEKGVSPRGHDHRGRWGELLDTCVSATSTLQTSAFLVPMLDVFGLPPVNKFSPWEVAASNAKMDGWFVFLDCLGVCRFTACDPKLVLGALKSITGIDLSLKEAMDIGRRTINTLRVFNYCHGLDTTREVPSFRYGSTPEGGPAEGKSIMQYFVFMKSLYFELNGWDSDTGVPLPHTLESLGIGELVNDLPAKD
jgi:aldehyde:ferredoxin oxidoreductase